MTRYNRISACQYHASETAYSGAKEIQYVVFSHLKETYEWPKSLDIKAGIVVECREDIVTVNVDQFKDIKEKRQIRYSTTKEVYSSPYTNPNLFDEIHDILTNGTAGTFILKDCRLIVSIGP